MFRRRDPKTDVIRRLPAFADQPARRVADASKVLDLVTVEAGRTLLTQGERGHEFYLVVEGRARVERDGQVIAHISDGAVIGEMALVGPGRRNATVVAETDMVLATSTRPYFAGLVADFPGFGRQVRQATEARTAVPA